ncbi:hypothetical protein, partial [Apilactobacillus xinyiensis]|uniref:hypothetical protein n=1 Tax=Apilactobacillus xinyiensis TaxID=2841032 RepID=UPI00200CCA25
NIQNKSYAGVKKHVEHDPNIKHSNKDIYDDRTQYNQSEILISKEDLLALKEKRYKVDLLKHNYSAYQSRHYKNMFDSFEDFMQYKEKNSSFDKSMVVTFGNKNDQDKLIEPETPMCFADDDTKQILINQSNALADYARSFNKRNKYLKIAEYTTNVDESTPHLHAQLIPLGRTAKGKASMSLNAALKAEFKYKTGKSIKDNRKVLSWFRNAEDSYLIQCMNKYMPQQYELTRTGEHYADFDTYKKFSNNLHNKLEVNRIETQKIDSFKQNIQKTKHDLAKFIRTENPNHTVSQKEVKHEQPEPIKTDRGFQQHLNSNILFLLNSSINIIDKSKKRNEESINKANLQIAKIADNFYKEFMNLGDKTRKLVTDFKHPQMLTFRNSDRTMSKEDYLVACLQQKTENISQRSNELDLRQKNLEIREQALKEKEERYKREHKLNSKYMRILSEQRREKNDQLMQQHNQSRGPHFHM